MPPLPPQSHIVPDGPADMNITSTPPLVSVGSTVTPIQNLIMDCKDRLAKINTKISEYAIQLSLGQISVVVLQEEVTKLNTLKMQIEQELDVLLKT